MKPLHNHTGGRGSAPAGTRSRAVAATSTAATAPSVAQVGIVITKVVSAVQHTISVPGHTRERKDGHGNARGSMKPEDLRGLRRSLMIGPPR